MDTIFLFLIPISLSLIICAASNGYFFYFQYKAMNKFFEKEEEILTSLVREVIEEVKQEEKVKNRTERVSQVD